MYKAYNILDSFSKKKKKESMKKLAKVFKKKKLKFEQKLFKSRVRLIRI